MTLVKDYTNKAVTYGQKLTINDGETSEEIDLTLINELKSKLEKKVIQRKTWKDRSCIQAIFEIQEDYEKLNDTLKSYFMSYLLSRIIGLSDLYLSVLEDPKSVLEWKEFLDKYKDLSNFPL